MILVDTSVWIDYFNGGENKDTNLLDSALVDSIVAIGDIILLEILQGFRNDKDFNKAKTTLATLELHEMFGRNMVGKCAANYRTLRKKGITIRKTTDIIIATFCIENQFPLLFSDRDFLPFVKYLKLNSVLDKT
ncbi:MAG: PIN domain nuclease [Gammaproteobacteria bacterium]|nr:PIN domain nuclease [Gammaproteobacteria bacterium]